MSTTVVCDFTFEAAHRLPRVSPGHKCARLHGHSYGLELHVCGPVDPHSGWVMDFADIAEAFAPLHRQLDHHTLNEVPGLDNPTCENIAAWLWQRLAPRLPGLAQVVVHETREVRCVYTGP